MERMLDQGLPIAVLRDRAIKAACLVGTSKALQTSLGFSGGCYDRIIPRLRKEGPEKTRRFLRYIYGRFENEEQDYFPGGMELADFLSSLGFMNWFSPQRIYESSDFRESIRRIERAFKIDHGLRVKLTPSLDEATDAFVNPSWTEPKERAAGRINEEVQKYPNYKGFKADVEVMALDAVKCGFGRLRRSLPDVFRDASKCAAGSAKYILAQDQLREKYPANPFGVLFDIYKLGVWPAGINRKDFVIYDPKSV